MKTFKNYGTNEVISEECYNKLPYCKRVKFARVDSGTITHHYNNDDDDSNLFLGLGTAIAITSLMDCSSSFSDSSSFTDSNDSFSGFDGGDFGGGGAGSDW